MTSRRRGRQFAIQLLYQKFFSEYESDKVFELFWDGLKTDKGTREFSEFLVLGTLDYRQELDMEISAYLKNWTLDRIAIMDHLILQLSFFELLHCSDVPWRVVIDEAVTLTKMFSSEKSATFINGVLHAWVTKNQEKEIVEPLPLPAPKRPRLRKPMEMKQQEAADTSPEINQQD